MCDKVDGVMGCATKRVHQQHGMVIAHDKVLVALPDAVLGASASDLLP